METEKSPPPFQMNSNGVCFAFPNNIEMSIVWAGGTMSTNRKESMYPEKKWESNTAEVALYYKGEILDKGEYLWGYLTIREVAKLIGIISISPPDNDIQEIKDFINKQWVPQLYQESESELLAKKYVDSEMAWQEVEDVHEVKDAK